MRGRPPRPRPTLRPTYGSKKPSHASGRAQAIGMVLSRLDRGLDVDPTMLACFGIKPAEAREIISNAAKSKTRGGMA